LDISSMLVFFLLRFLLFFSVEDEDFILQLLIFSSSKSLPLST